MGLSHDPGFLKPLVGFCGHHLSSVFRLGLNTFARASHNWPLQKDLKSSLFMTSSCIASTEGTDGRLTRDEEWGWYFHPSSSSLTQGQRLALLSYWNHSQQAALSLQPHTTGFWNSPNLDPWSIEDSQLQVGLGGTSSVLRTISEAPTPTSMSHLSVGFSSNKSPPSPGPWLVHGVSFWLLSPEPCPQDSLPLMTHSAWLMSG